MSHDQLIAYLTAKIRTQSDIQELYRLASKYGFKVAKEQ